MSTENRGVVRGEKQAIARNISKQQRNRHIVLVERQVFSYRRRPASPCIACRTNCRASNLRFRRCNPPRQRGTHFNNDLTCLKTNALPGSYSVQPRHRVRAAQIKHITRAAQLSMPVQQRCNSRISVPTKTPPSSIASLLPFLRTFCPALLHHAHQVISASFTSDQTSIDLTAFLSPPLHRCV